MPRFQFSLRDVLWLVLVVAAFFGGIHFERERKRRDDEAARAAAFEREFGTDPRAYLQYVLDHHAH